ncbi:MAG: hypothetical protein WC829_17265 [Hyphomicrobium sp.]
MSNSTPGLVYDRHRLTAQEIQRAGAEYARGVVADREHFRAHEPGYYLRPTLPLELRAIMFETGLSGVPGLYPKWPGGLVAMRQVGCSVDRRFCIQTPRNSTKEALAAAVRILPPALFWGQVDEQVRAGEPLVYADVIALGAGA